MSLKVNQFVHFASTQLVGAVAFGDALVSNLEIKADHESPLSALVTVTRTGDVLEAVIAQTAADGSSLEPRTARECEWTVLAQSVCDLIEADLMDCEHVTVKLWGEPAPGRNLPAAAGNSDDGEITVIQPAAALAPSVVSVAGGADKGAFIAAAVDIAVDFVAAGEHDSARICLQGERSACPTWILLDKYTSEEAGTRLFARTNDGDLMVGYPPTLCVARADGSELKGLIGEYLAATLAAEPVVAVKVFREKFRGQTSVLTGNSVDATLAEMPEFPSL